MVLDFHFLSPTFLTLTIQIYFLHYHSVKRKNRDEVRFGVISISKRCEPKFSYQ